VTTHSLLYSVDEPVFSPFPFDLEGEQVVINPSLMPSLRAVDEEEVASCLLL